MIRSIKRQLINLSDEDKQCLFDNMWYRHQLYNLAIETILEYRKDNPKKVPTSTELYHVMKDKISDIYDIEKYAEGIESIIRTDIRRMYNNVFNNTIHYKDDNERFKFHKFNRYHRSFGFSARSYKSQKGTKVSRIRAFTNNSISIRFRKGNIKTFYHNELSWNNKNHPYVFDMYDIKEVSFIYDHGKFYIILYCKVKFKNPYKKEDNRTYLAGIDLGERNPAMIYDGKEYIKIPFPDKKMKVINKRIDKLNHYLSGKVYGSRNYYKLKSKIDKLYRKGKNIRLDWRNQFTYRISNKFKVIVVDDFHDYMITKDSDSDVTGKVKHTMNRVMSDRGMFYFMITLKYMCEKYRCYYITSDKDTTRTCSKCGYINDPLPLSEEYLVCENCGRKIHRDKNAAKNCYNQHKDKYHIYIS